ncbi:MAG: hypothetical protein ACYTFG_20895, partial [Planctomycetota bacterium]
MKKTILLSTLAMLAFSVSPARGQAKRGQPEIGYLYPAGGQQGTIVRVIVGGQNLRNIKGVHVTGEGLFPSVVRYMGRFTRLNGEERRALAEMIVEAKKAIDPEVKLDPRTAQWMKRKPRKSPKKESGEKKDENPAAAGKEEKDPGLRKITRHPLLRDLGKLDMEELDFIERKFIWFNRREQPNAQIGETAMIEVFIDPLAPPGDRELRLITGQGLTNAMCFQVGQLPEVQEPNPGDPRP